MKVKDKFEKDAGKINIVLVLVLVSVFLFLTIIVAGFGYIFLYSAKNTEIYACALSEAKNNQKIISEIGESFEPGFLVWTSNWSYGKFSERAEFSTSLNGTKGEGTLHVQAYKDIDFSSLILIFENGKPEVVYQGKYPCEDN